MLIKELCETFEYKITDGTEYCWNSYGPNARYLDFSNHIAHGSVIFDSATQHVYQAEVWFTEGKKSPYRWIDSNLKDKVLLEAKQKDVDLSIAFDSVKFIDVEVEEDFLEKAHAIWRNLSFDTRIQVPIDTDVFYDLAKLAHKRDITVNKLAEEILLELINKENQNENQNTCC